MVVACVVCSCDIFGPGDGDCTSDPSPAFTHMFTDLARVRSIVPLGTPSSGGEIKERHQVQLLTDVDAAGVTRGRSAPVIAAAPARLQSVRRYRATSPPAPFPDEYYGFVLQFTCEVTARFDHVRVAEEKLLGALRPGFTTTFERPVRETTFSAGEVIGYTDGNPPAPAGEHRAFAFDYAVYDETHENRFANTERYRRTRNLRQNIHSVCGGVFYSGPLRSEFDAALGYAGHSAGGDCRSASRDVPGAIAGGWFRVGAAEESTGWRLAIATEFDGVTRLAIHPSEAFFFAPIRTTGTVNLDPALAAGTSPYCYTDRSSEFWFRLSGDGLRLSMQRATGNCTGPPPATFTVEWER